MTNAADTTTPASAPTLEHLDAASVTLGENMRYSTSDTVTADAAFIASIRTQGVIVPVLGYRDGEAVVIVAGKRRTLAAVHLGAKLPVIVHPQPPADLDRLISQWDENERRAPMGDSDRLAGMEQMALLGTPVAQIAKRTSQTKEAVASALAVGKSSTARDLMHDQGLTLDQAAVLVEFEDDPDTVATLTDAAASDEYDFDHTAAVIRTERMEAEALAAATVALAEQGITPIERPAWNSAAEELGRLVDKATGEDITPEAHATCPGHAIWLDFQRWGNEPGVQQHTVCTNPKANGHKDRYSDTGGASVRGPMSEEEKADRKTLIANNKAWDAATEVRRAFLVKVAQRKTPPTGAEALIAAAVAHVGHYGSNKGPSEALDTLSPDPAKTAKEVSLKTTTAKRQTVLALAVVLGTWEADANRTTWRSPRPWDARIMGHLIEWGYNPSEVETLITKTKK